MKSETSLRGMIYASMFGAGTAAGAYLAIPLPPVPITLQTFVLFMAGALLGGRLGALSQVVYVLLGVMGLPVFAGGKAGLGVLFGPTGGYLLGFVAGAFVVGSLISMRRRPGLAWHFCAMAAGTLVIYLFGVIQLSLVAKLTLSKSVAVGVVPFIVGDVFKIVAAGVLSIKIREKIKT
jgi:biotin transport system substrate-specific component